MAMQQLLRHLISNFQQSNGYFVSVGYKVPLGKKYYLSSKWINGDVSRRILVLDTSIFIHFDDKYFRTERVENRVGDDGVRAILQYRPSDLYLTDRKETMAILQKYTHTYLHVRK